MEAELGISHRIEELSNSFVRTVTGALRPQVAFVAPVTAWDLRASVRSDGRALGRTRGCHVLGASSVFFSSSFLLFSSLSKAFCSEGQAQSSAPLASNHVAPGHGRARWKMLCEPKRSPGSGWLQQQGLEDDILKYPLLSLIACAWGEAMNHVSRCLTGHHEPPTC